MKKSIFALFIFAFLSSFSFSQTVNGIPLSQIDVEYISLTSSSNWGSGIRLSLDYGQENTVGRREFTVMDNDGQPLRFNSLIHGLNFMNKLGYELDQAFNTGGDRGYSVYLLRRMKE